MLEPIIRSNKIMFWASNDVFFLSIIVTINNINIFIYDKQLGTIIVSANLNHKACRCFTKGRHKKNYFLSSPATKAFSPPPLGLVAI